jgi:hypothetical protein
LKHRAGFCVVILGSFILHNAVHAQSPVLPSGLAGKSASGDAMLLPDQNATFQLIISLTVKPETATSYDRTWISIESSPQTNLEVVEIRDETRGITTKYRGSSVTLETLFGPKSGLTDTVVVSALVRIPRQSGEKILRKMIRLRNVPAEILQNAERHGHVRVNVQLDFLSKSPKSLELGDATVQRELIASAQDDLLLNLAGTEYKILRRFESNASFLLEAGPSALAVLDRLPQVIKIKEDVILRGFIQ